MGIEQASRRGRLRGQVVAAELVLELVRVEPSQGPTWLSLAATTKEQVVAIHSVLPVGFQVDYTHNLPTYAWEQSVGSFRSPC